jgi:hypothetical protein
VEPGTGHVKMRRYLKPVEIALFCVAGASMPAAGQHASVDECIEKIALDLYYKTESYARTHGKLPVTVVLEGQIGIGRGIVTRLKANEMINNRYSFLSVTTNQPEAGPDKLVINVYALEPNYIIDYRIIMADQPVARAETALSIPLADSMSEAEPVAYNTPPAETAKPYSTESRSSGKSMEMFKKGLVWIAIIAAFIYFMGPELFN